jgi:hypothetical protein
MCKEKFKNICFIEGSHSYRVQTVVGSRNSEIFSEIICDVSSFLGVQSVSEKARPLIYFSIYERRQREEPGQNQLEGMAEDNRMFLQNVCIRHKVTCCHSSEDHNFNNHHYNQKPLNTFNLCCFQWWCNGYRALYGAQSWMVPYGEFL